MTTPQKHLYVPMAAFNLYACTEAAERVAALRYYEHAITRECAALGQPVNMGWLFSLCGEGLHVLLLQDGTRICGIILLFPTVNLLTGAKELYLLFAYVEAGYNAHNFLADTLPEYAAMLGYTRLSITAMRKGWERLASVRGWTREAQIFSVGT